jgi:hypothetical protein
MESGTFAFPNVPPLNHHLCKRGKTYYYFIIPLNSFAVGLDPPALLRTAHGLTRTTDWGLHLYRPTPRHLMALASLAGAPARIEVREWMPGDIEDSLDIFVPRDAKGPTRQDGAWGLQPRSWEAFEAGGH